MHGSLSTVEPDTPAGSLSAKSLGALLATMVVGVVAGLVSAHVRLHLGLPGHKALLWMTPVIVARLAFRSKVGATAGTFTAALAALGAGNSFAGSVTGLPLAVLAGAALDLAIHFVERRGLHAGWAILLVAFAGMGANLVLLAKRLLSPILESNAFLGVPGLGGRALSYAVFGLLAGGIAALLARLVVKRKATT